MSEATIPRVIEHGVGWTAGGLPPEAIAPYVSKVREAWHQARDGEPRIVGLAYFSLGDTEAASRGYLLDYYKFTGEMAEMIAGGALRSPDVIRNAVQAYAEAGLDELILDPTVSDPRQVDLLAEVVL